MRFYTADFDGTEKILAGIEENSGYILEELGFKYDDMNDLICHMTSDERKRLQGILTGEVKADRHDIGKIKLCAPIVRPKQDVICLGINYDEHAVEAGRFSDEAFGGERPYTIYFSKRVNRAAADGEEIPSYKDMVDSLDYEAELGVILGRDAKNVNKEEAEDYIFGYTIINDISARNLQTRHKQWYLGKSLDGFTPVGPCIVTADEIDNVQNLDICSFVNGEKRQSSNTRYMIQTVAGAIEELSRGMTLQAGTIIATGTPAGVGMGMTPPVFLKTGDVIKCRIEKIGCITNIIGE